MIWIILAIAAALLAGGFYLAWRLIGTTGQHAEPFDWRERTLPFILPRGRSDSLDQLAARYYIPAALLEELLQTEHYLRTVDRALQEAITL